MKWSANGCFENFFSGVDYYNIRCIHINGNVKCKLSLNKWKRLYKIKWWIMKMWGGLIKACFSLILFRMWMIKGNFGIYLVHWYFAFGSGSVYSKAILIEWPFTQISYNALVQINWSNWFHACKCKQNSYYSCTIMEKYV